MEKQLKFKVPWRVRSINIEGLLPQGGNRAKRLEVNFINPIELALDSLLSALDSGTPLLLEVRKLVMLHIFILIHVYIHAHTRTRTLTLILTILV